MECRFGAVRLQIPFGVQVQCIPRGRDGCCQVKSTTLDMVKGKTSGVKQQARQTGEFGKRPVLVLVSVLAVSDDGMPEMTEVQSDLMVTTGMRFALDQRQARRFISCYRVRQITGGHRCIGSPRQFGRPGYSFWKGFSDAAFMIDMAANHSEIRFVCFSRFELRLAGVNGFGIFPEYNHPACGFVQTMNRIDSARYMGFEEVF